MNKIQELWIWTELVWQDVELEFEVEWQEEELYMLE